MDCVLFQPGFVGQIICGSLSGGDSRRLQPEFLHARYPVGLGREAPMFLEVEEKAR
jgi:hypothetical protein